MNCPRCESPEVIKRGLKSGFQRYLCKGCGRYFTDRPPRFSPGIKARAVDMYLNNVGIRKIARFVGASPAGVLGWIRKEHGAVQQRLAQARPVEAALPDVIEMDEIYTIVQKKRSGR